MVNKRASSPTLEGTSGSDDVDALEEIHAFVDELHYHNQTFENDVHIIKQR